MPLPSAKADFSKLGVRLALGVLFDHATQLEQELQAMAHQIAQIEQRLQAIEGAGQKIP